MTDLFRLEAESQAQVLAKSLLELERTPTAASHLDACMRAAHSIKGAARLVGIAPVIEVAHAMEDCFVAAQRGTILLDSKQIDRLLEGVDLLHQAARAVADVPIEVLQVEVERFTAALAELLTQAPVTDAGVAGAEAVPRTAVAPPPPGSTPPSAPAPAEPPTTALEERRVLRVTAENFNRLLGLASESLVQSRRLKPTLAALQRLRRLHQGADAILDELRDVPAAVSADPKLPSGWAGMRAWLVECQDELTRQLVVLETFDSRATNLAQRLHNEVLACRMRPFADGMAGFPKMVRGLARSLGKKARLELSGETTLVDRDVLETLESPLAHLLRNAVDHGIEMPEARLAVGKPAEGLIRLEASHSAGMLQIVIADDGGGVDLDRLRAEIVARNLARPSMIETLTDAELLEFLFLPSFTMKSIVTEISGRGVGLDAVRSTIKLVRGTIRATSRVGHGTRFELRLPLTLSVLRTLLADVGGEAYAFPLAQIVRAVNVPRDEIELVGGKPHCRLDNQLIGLMDAAQMLGGQPAAVEQDVVPVVLIADSDVTYGLMVDRFLGECETVVQPLDSRLGAIADIMAGGVMEDGAPVLIVDVTDLTRSVEKMTAGRTLSTVSQSRPRAPQRQRRRVLVVDDSLTVRELQRKLLDQAGYVVETAVDGLEGWNVVRMRRFDLAITDVDMPRMDGIELVRLIKQDPNLTSLPVMIVSYKDEEADRRRGLEAGADYYLPKAGFDEENLLQAVRDLIGEATA
jgi:two-component system sensor histidine kinase and response regulator WspE